MLYLPFFTLVFLSTISLHSYRILHTIVYSEYVLMSRPVPLNRAKVGHHQKSPPNSTGAEHLQNVRNNLNCGVNNRMTRSGIV